MTNNHRLFAQDALPSPFPEGWYFVASRRAIAKAGIVQRTWMGEDIIAWADDEGRVCVAEAYCPHLGSYLGPDAGGRVRNGQLVCPFHGYEYDATGQCVATPYAEPPKTARLRVYPTQDVAGLVFAWWGIGGRGPQWELHPDPPNNDGWCGHSIKTLRFSGHPQETTENSVDLAHLRYVHGYGNVERVGKVTVDGAYLVSRFDFRSVRRFGKVAKFSLSVSANTFISGLGYSFVAIREHTIGMDLRLWVLSTPVDGTHVDMTLVSQVREIRSPKQLGLGLLPVRLRAPIVNRFIAATQYRDVLQDVAIWSRKRFRSRPRLCRSDGEIMPFRAYCAQFYPGSLDAASPMPEREKVAR